jgi:Concanavalin A-like lectin/glucanases superfamily
MNVLSPIAIILGIIIVVLIYVLYKYFTTSTATLGSLVDLSKTNSGTPFTKKEDLKDPTTTRYSYGLWLYIDTWDTTSDKTIFYRKSSAVPTPLYDIKLYLDTSSPTLRCSFYTTTTDSSKTETIIITTNFPIQKWVYITVSVDNNIIDCYIDGKLVTSQQLKGNLQSQTNSDIYVGNFNAHLAKFQRTNAPTDPQTVWSNYSAGNGGNSLKKMFSSYGVDVSFKKDNIEQQKFSII